MQKPVLTDYEIAEKALSDTIASYDVDARIWRECGTDKERLFSNLKWVEQFNTLNQLLTPAKRWPWEDPNMPKRRLKILELGCCLGRDSKRFIENGFDYVGVDRSMESLNMAREFTHDFKETYGAAPVFQHMDIRDLEFGPEVFDGFWAAMSLNHLESRNTGALEEALIDLSRVLKRSAYGFIAVEEGETGQHYQPTRGNIRCYLSSEEDFSEILLMAGFELIRPPNKSKLSRRNMAGVEVQGTLEYFVRYDGI